MSLRRLFFLWGQLAFRLGSGGELLDGAVVVLGGEGLQGAPAVCVQLDDLHEERAGQRRFGRTQHLVPDGGQELGHHLRELLLQEAPHALQLPERRGGGIRVGEEVTRGMRASQARLAPLLPWIQSEVHTPSSARAVCLLLSHPGCQGCACVCWASAKC